jgi:hypothetical protein
MITAPAKRVQKGWWSVISTMPATAIALFPAAFCPACYPALAGLLSALGLGALVSDVVLKPLTVLFLLISLFSLAYQSRRTKRWGPLLVGSLGSIGIYLGLYVLPFRALKIASVVLLIGASIWNVVLTKTKTSGASCSACPTKEGQSHG